MDLDSIVSLESAFQEYNGTMLVISHDKTFLDSIVNETWEFTTHSDNEYKIIL